LPADDFRHGRAARNEHPAYRVLNHLIFALRQSTLRLPGSEFPKRAAKEKIEDDEEDEDKDDSIHSGTKPVTPQSYGDCLSPVNIRKALLLISATRFDIDPTAYSTPFFQA